MKKTLTIFAALAALFVPLNAVAGGQGPLSAKHRAASGLKLNRPSPTGRSLPQAAGPNRAIALPGASAPAQVIATVPGSNTVLCGIKCYDDAWLDDNATIDAGIYNVQAKPGGALTGVSLSRDWMFARSAVLVGSTYYVLSASFDGESCYYANYSASTWYLGTRSEADAVNVATDLAYDPTTGKVWGFFYDENTGDYTRFCSFDLALGEAIDVGNADRSCYALACNKQGELYGVSRYGTLYKIDKATGIETYIGSTGKTPVDRNSMTFDDATGRLYWASTYQSWDDQGKSDWKSALFEVNTHNGQLTKIMDLPGNASFAGLFARPYQVPLGAPQAVTNIGVKYNAFGDLQGDISFTAPTKNVDGTDISEPLNVIVNIMGTDTVVAGVQPGATHTMPQVSMEPGYQTLSFTPCNSQWQGEMAWHTTYVGEDIPGVPQNVTLSDQDGKAALSWSAAPLGMNGGEYDHSQVAYSIVRYPDTVVVASDCKDTTFIDATLPQGSRAYYYEVTAFTKKGQSDPAASNKVAFGEGYMVPFVESFDKQESFDLWTIADLNGGTTWSYDSINHNIFYSYDLSPDRKPGDDWIISPKIALKAGYTYRLSLTARNYSKNYPENFKVSLGTQPTPEAMTQDLLVCPDFVSTTAQRQQVTFSVAADGFYYLGIYDYSNPYMYRLDIDEVGIDLLDAHAPAAVTGLKATAGDKGALNATLTFNAPTRDTNDGALSSITAINIYRDEATAPVKSFINPEPGAALSWTDDRFSEAGSATYRVVAANEAGSGAEAEVTVWVGVDKPGAPRNLRLEDHDGNAVLTWEAPQVGSHGGYIDASKLVYEVWRYDNTTKLAENVKATTYTDATINATSQVLVDYVVFPYIDGVRGDYALSDAVIFGDAYTTPTAETFKGSDMNHYPWVTESDKPMVQGWTLDPMGANPATTDQNGDQGLATFHSMGEGLGIHARFSSPKFNISSLANPELSFWMYHSHNDTIATAETIEVEVKDGNGDFTKVEGAKWLRDIDGTNGWKRHTVSLAPWKGAKNLRVAFVGTTAGGQNIFIDNVAIASATTVDLEATALDAPTRMAQGEPAPVSLKVTNVGSEPVNAFTVTLTDQTGARLATVQGSALASGEERTVDLPVKFAKVQDCTLTATVACQGDENSANNSLQAVTHVVTPVIAAPDTLTATVNNGSAVLNWRSPLEHGSVTDNVESYQDFAIDSIGDWTMVDLDFANTYGIKKDLDNYPHMNDPKAFQVINARKLGINIWAEGTPHSGDKFFASMASVSGQNNDWMISPRLNGQEQVISFWAKSFTSQGGNEERMRVLASTTGTDPVNFTPVSLGDYVSLPETWTQYSYRLPQGTRYFAINGVSPGGDNSFGLFVDDLAFNDLTVPAWTLTGYQVYRDGKLIGTTATPTYVDADFASASGTVTYAVCAVYEQGISPMSNEVKLQASGVTDLTAGKQVQSITYVNALGQQSSQPFEGVNVVVTRYTDGSTATAKQLR